MVRKAPGQAACLVNWRLLRSNVLNGVTMRGIAGKHGKVTGWFQTTCGNFIARAIFFDSDTHACHLYSKMQPQTRAHAHCAVAKELPNPCMIQSGQWVMDSDQTIYYVGDEYGSLYRTDSSPTCYGLDVWGSSLPKLFCASSEECDQCIDSLKVHGRYKGSFDCGVYHHQLMRTCQYSNLELQCQHGQLLKIFSATYGRLDTTFCPDPTSSGQLVGDTMTTQTLCGEIDNVLSVVEAACNGRPLCNLLVNSRNMGKEECSTVFKYLEVEYMCGYTSASLVH